MLGDPITDITIAMEMNYFQLNRAEYFVPVVVKIPGSELRARQEAAAPQRTLIDFIGEIKDDYGYTHAEHPRQARHQADERDRGAARDAARSSTRPGSRCCPASTSSSCWRATRKPAASARIRRRSRCRT